MGDAQFFVVGPVDGAREGPVDQRLDRLCLRQPNHDPQPHLLLVLKLLSVYIKAETGGLNISLPILGLTYVFVFWENKTFIRPERYCVAIYYSVVVWF